MIKRAGVLLLLLGCFCVGPTDDESQVKDLRVLGINFEPPELMASNCDFLRPDAGPPAADAGPPAVLVFASPVTMTWLILDRKPDAGGAGPDGGAREISYTVTACANQGDRTCNNPGDFRELARGTTRPGELKLTLVPGLTVVDDGPLLEEVALQDAYRGLGGVRMPIMLRVKAGTEEVYAQKLMVFSCRLFPSMKPNLNPQLPGILFTDGGLWGEADTPAIAGHGDAGVKIEALSFTDRQEQYVVPSFELKPLTLVESWKISWTADLGKFSPTESGGVGFDGTESKIRSEWKATSSDKDETDVHFWFIVRDGRGGQSWISRTAHFKP